MGLFRRSKTPVGTRGGGAPPAYEYAVVDVETTGLDRQGDRIVELAVVVLDPNANPVYEWSSVLDPGTGSAGPTHIHGITDAMVSAAPTFDQVAGDVAYLLGGRYLVAHNAAFDTAFLEAAFHRAGMPLTGQGLHNICTMQMADAAGLPRRLGDLCADLGIFYDPHSALDDARVTAAVFGRFLPMVDPASFTSGPTPPDTFVRAGPRTGVAFPRAQAIAQVTPVDLAGRVADRFSPTDGSQDAANGYRKALVARLAEKPLNLADGDALVARAVAGGLSLAQCREAHHDAVAGMFDTALADGRVAKAERAAIEEAAVWLGVDVGDFDTFVKAARARRKMDVAAFRSQVAGTTIVMTGRGVHPTNIREALAVKLGFTISATYRPGAHLVVIGSETTDTAAAAAARADGATVMLEADFWRRLGEL